MANSLTVLIAVAGQPELLRRTLDSLAYATLPANYAGTVIVENGRPTGIRRVAASFEHKLNCRYLYAAEANKSHALNVGLTTIDRGLIVFLDDDVRVAPGLLDAYAAGSAGIERGECYGGPLSIDQEIAAGPAWLTPYLPKSARGWQLPYDLKTRLTKQKFLGPNWAAFAKDVRQIGGFETRLGPGAQTGATGQETDAQTRLRAAGVQSYYLPAAEAWHYVRANCQTPEWIVARARRHGREWGLNRARRKNFSTATRLMYGMHYLAAILRINCLQTFGNEQGRFQAAYLESLWDGRHEGLALGSQWNDLPQIAISEEPARSSKAAA